MAKYNFLDYDGLEKLLQSINSYYASKEKVNNALNTLGQSLEGQISEKETEILRLIDTVKTGLERALVSEETARTTADTSLQTAIDTLASALTTVRTDFNAALTAAVSLEQTQRATADSDLQDQIGTLNTDLTTEISNRETAITTLSGNIDARLITLSDTLSSTLRGYIDQKIAELDFEGVKDIIIIPEGELLPTPGVESYLYITSDHAIHQWVGISEEYPDGWKTLGEDSAAEIAALAERITILESQDKVDTSVYEAFIETYELKTQEIDQNLLDLGNAVDNLGTAVGSKISGVKVNGEIAPIEDGIAVVTVSSGGGGEGTDPELRADFEAFKATVNPQLASFSNHLENWENPHHVSKADLELDQVNNTSDENKPISIATQAALDSKVDSTTHEEDLAGKISYGDIVDDLYTPDPERPLSANQGVEIDAAINEVKSSITALEAGLVFKGTVPSYNDLPADAQNGFCYQIFSNTSDVHHGEIYAMTETGWVQIVASAQDMSSLIASQAEINKIITDYR